MLAKTSLMLAFSVLSGILVSFGAADQAVAFASKSAPPASEASSGGSSSMDGSVASPSVWITRPDGAQQCAPKSGQTLESSAQELKRAQVRVLSSQKGSDNRMHAQMCGIPAGKTNMFQIPKEDLPKAMALGFQQVKE